MQRGEERLRWLSMSEQLLIHGLVQRDIGVEFTRISDDEEQPNSMIDHLFCDSRLAANGSASWDGAPGDHCLYLRYG